VIRRRLQLGAYRVEQRAAGAWLARRRRGDFDGVETFCLFVGYPRSGHSIVGGLLDAHRSAIVAHEAGAHELVLAGRSRDEVYGRLLARSAWFAWRGSRASYSYAVPGQWQGRYDELRVIGDKRGGAIARTLAVEPDLLERVRALVGVPLRLIHVVRNPFDNIAAISIWHRLSLAAAVEHYFRHADATAQLERFTAPEEVLTARHEEFIADPAATLGALCAHLGLEPDSGYVEACARVVFTEPTFTRNRLTWPDELVGSVEARIAEHPALAHYSFARQ
jgi:hypothetical protein